MRMNICLVKAFQFLQQFYIMVNHKPEKEYIVPNTLNRLSNTNRARHDNLYSELDALFTYHATLMEISPNLIKRIFDGYLADNW